MRNKKSYLYKFLMYFMLTLLVPLLTIVFIYRQAETKVRSQILVSNSNNLNQFFSIVNVITEEMGNICTTVITSEECSRYSYYSNYYIEKAPYEVLTVRKMLSKFQDDRYYDVFVYFPMEDRIISSTKASLTSDYYYETYYADENVDFYYEFNEVLNCEDKRPTFFVMNRGGEDYYLCVAMKQFNYKEPQLSFVTVVVLEKGFLNRLAVEENLVGGNVVMFDENGEMLLSNDLNFGMRYLDMNVERGEFYQTEIAGNLYMMIVKEANGIAGYYASAIPLDFFWEQLNQMRLICGIGIFVCVLVSVIIALISTMRTYRPVMNVVEKLQEYTNKIFDKKEDVEFEFITKIFEEQKEKQRLLMRELNNNKMSHRRNMIINLLNGRIEDKNGIEFDSNFFSVADVLIQATDQRKKELSCFPFDFTNILEEMFVEESKVFAVIDTEGRHVILMNLKEMDDELKMKDVSKSILSKIESYLKQQYHLDITVGLSDIHEGIDAIVDAYQEAKKALSYKYLMEDISIIEYEQIISRKLYYPISFESRLYRMIREFVKKLATEDRIDSMASGASKKDSENFVGKLVELFGINKDASMETVDYFKYEVANTVIQVMVSLGISLEEGKLVAEELMNKDSLKQFLLELEGTLEILSKKEKEKEMQNDVCKLAKQYIENHYYDPKLSLTDIGDRVHLSGTYISRVFKEKYGKSIPTYIVEVRINNAKTALQETEKSIQQISTENGFLSSNVFIKSFKKQEGITPGLFRKLNKERNES